jgi:hypothetical protein
MSDEKDHGIFERVAVLETKVRAIESNDEGDEEKESGLAAKFGGVPLASWLWFIGILTALGQGPDLVKIIAALAKTGLVK